MKFLKIVLLSISFGLFFSSIHGSENEGDLYLYYVETLQQIKNAEYNSKYLHDIHVALNNPSTPHQLIHRSLDINGRPIEAVTQKIKRRVEKNKSAIYSSKLFASVLTLFAIPFSAAACYYFNTLENDPLPYVSYTCQVVAYSMSGAMIYTSWKMLKTATDVLPGYTEAFEQYAEKYDKHSLM